MNFWDWFIRPIAEAVGEEMSYLSFPQFPQQGWECPKCGGVYSPTTPQCFRCPEQTVTTGDAAGSAKLLGVCPSCGKENGTSWHYLCNACAAKALGQQNAYRYRGTKDE